MIKTITKHTHSFLVDASANLAFWNVFEESGWENETFKVFNELINKESVVIDIGSWEGPFTLFSAVLGKKVYAIEPDPVAYKALLKNLDLNPTLKEKIFPHNIAFSENDGTIKLFARNTYGDSASSLLSRSRDTSQGIDVATLTFKNFIRSANIEKAEFIKMDIEGTEFFILPGMADTLKKIGLPFLLISFHPKYLQEYFMKKNISNRFLSKVIFKIASWAGIFLFDKKVKAFFLENFNSLSTYVFLFEPDGKIIDKASFFEKKKYRQSQAILFSAEKLTF